MQMPQERTQEDINKNLPTILEEGPNGEEESEIFGEIDSNIEDL